MFGDYFTISYSLRWRNVFDDELFKNVLNDWFMAKLQVVAVVLH